MKLFLLLSIVFNLTYFSHAQNSGYNLFKIERNLDSDFIKYDINLNENGDINIDKPLKIYWVRCEENNKIEKLSFIQNSLAYGLDFLSISKDEVKFQFVSIDKMTFTVKKNNKDLYRRYAVIDNNGIETIKIFVQIDGGTFMFPKISYIQLYWESLDGLLSNVSNLIF